MNKTFTGKGLATALCGIMLLIFTSCGGSGRNATIPGLTGPTVNLLQDQLLISMVFNNIQTEGGLRYQIPKYNNSYVEISPDVQSDGTLLAITVSLDDLFSGDLQQMPAEYLPGGRPIPGIATGTLPAIAFSIPSFHNITFYVGQSLFGMFIPVKGLNLQGTILTSRFYTGRTRVGNLSIVPDDENGENGGFLLLLTVSQSRIQSLQRRAARY